MGSPFETGRCGGSQRMEIALVATSTDAITAAENRNGHLTSSSAQEIKSSCAQLTEMLFSSGGEPNTGRTNRTALNAPCSETKGRTYRRSLSDRLTQSLITAGLVCGITPSSIRQLSGQPIRVLAFDMPDGGAAVSPAKVFSSSSECDSPTQEGA